MAATFRLAMVSDANSVEDRNALSPWQLRHCDVCCHLPQSTRAVAQHVSPSWIISIIRQTLLVEDVTRRYRVVGSTSVLEPQYRCGGVEVSVVVDGSELVCGGK